MIRTTLLALLLSGSTLRADDWPQFRGPSGSGKAPGAEAPVEWGPGKNIRWRVSLDGLGNSSPIISGGRVFVTVATEKGKSRSLHCFDRKTGGLLWTATVKFPGIEPTLEDNPSCG